MVARYRSVPSWISRGSASSVCGSVRRCWDSSDRWVGGRRRRRLVAPSKTPPRSTRCHRSRAPPVRRFHRLSPGSRWSNSPTAGRKSKSAESRLRIAGPPGTTSLSIRLFEATFAASRRPRPFQIESFQPVSRRSPRNGFPARARRSRFDATRTHPEWSPRLSWSSRPAHWGGLPAMPPNARASLHAVGQNSGRCLPNFGGLANALAHSLAGHIADRPTSRTR